MPRGDGTGPPRGQDGRGGRMGGTQPGTGPGGDCICPSCGTRVPHQRGTPCYSLDCPKCKVKMIKG